MRFLTLAASISMIAAAAVAGQTPEPSQVSGREATGLLLAGDAAALQARFSPAFLAALGGDAGVRRFIETVRASAGTERDVLDEVAFVEGGLTSYYHRSRFDKLPDVTIRWIIDKAGLIQGGSVKPTVQPYVSTNTARRPHVPLQLPFAAASEGRWYVAWGGNDAIRNYHVAARDQHFALDLVVLKDTMPFRGKGKRNEDHFCFGQPILAPAAGRVTEVVGDLPDNAPGSQDAERPAGNHIVIDHGNGEYSLLAHLQQGSVAVKQGQSIRSGAQIGRCGNSGKSTLPHLHYHLQDAPAFGSGDGLPVRFSSPASSSGDAREFVRGQYLTVAPPSNRTSPR